MFHDIPDAITMRMRALEEADARDRVDGTIRMRRLRQISPETGKFMALLAACAPDGIYLEIGTSAGYSTLWLALACREMGRKITTFEVSEEKAAMAKETFRVAGVEETVDLVVGDARDHLSEYEGVAFCFLDAEKEVYGDCYEAVVPGMVGGGLLVADNVISHRAILQPLVDRALKDARVDALVVPIGKGELVCRRI
jgi:predicted O-methyltransferase YrrM